MYDYYMICIVLYALLQFYLLIKLKVSDDKFFQQASTLKKRLLTFNSWFIIFAAIPVVRYITDPVLQIRHIPAWTVYLYSFLLLSGFLLSIIATITWFRQADITNKTGRYIMLTVSMFSGGIFFTYGILSFIFLMIRTLDASSGSF